MSTLYLSLLMPTAADVLAEGCATRLGASTPAGKILHIPETHGKRQTLETSGC
jgi:hypothetical protein